jgi:cytidine deaminase
MMDDRENPNNHERSHKQADASKTRMTEYLVEQAIAARERAYAPYSHFLVGAALLDEAGRIHQGCNVENSSYGATNCAERTALFGAIASGSKARSFRMLAIVGDTAGPIRPCGVCRQVLAELCSPDMPVVMANLTGARQTLTVAQLLPLAFELRET